MTTEEPQRKCPHCSRLLPETTFGVSVAPSGQSRPQSWCMDCRRNQLEDLSKLVSSKDRTEQK